MDCLDEDLRDNYDEPGTLGPHNSRMGYKNP